MELSEKLVLALPKGRILEEVMPLVHAAGIHPEPAFDDPKSRALQFDTNVKNLSIIRVRAFDAATFAAFGAAHLAVVGNDVLQEFGYSDLYSPLDLDIGHCRLSLAMPEDEADEDPREWSHIRVATKYPNLTRRYYAERGVQAECIKLNGAMELAPQLGLSRRIVDLVSTGGTLKANKLKEVEVLTHITSRLVVHRAAFKTRPREVSYWIERFREAVKNGSAS
ncbi:ATP phosphoribosyltransferase [Kordiimonas gwangyangensis]|uniref:ATP phosphoribosyltransferase n=1 Tax=Kordiimonas gwangyangensis TaxID=288022 RepID=UPI00035F44E5|nr:ATP phosphoribosyltransferase [Kordiimonas gwangyangensis]